MKAAVIIVAVLLVVSAAGIIVLELLVSSDYDASKEPVVVLAVWDVKPALDEIIGRYEAQTGRRVEVRFGSSRELLARLKLDGRGDVLICSSVVARARASNEGLITRWAPGALAYLVPAIITRFDCPVEVTGLDTLVAEGLSLVIADPEQEPMGRFAAHMLEEAGLGKDARALIALTPADAPTVVELVSLGRVDAAIAWGAMQQWDPEFLRVLKVERSVTGVAAVRVAVTTFARDTAAADELVAVLRSAESQEVFRKWQYAATLDEAAKAAPRVSRAGLGKEPDVPERWRGQTENTDPGETP
ncbi:MAG: substrate-binding domain-containing protein [Verrucomicrobia bacterium]|nr:substrate-binding domain-containing protein [Verrucomicrobiota bacterium]